MEFKEKLKSLRQDKKLTRKQLAELTGISVSSIEKYEYGLKIPRLDNVMLMAEALNCDLIELVSLLDNYENIYNIITDYYYLIPKSDLEELPDSVKKDFLKLIEVVSSNNNTANTNIKSISNILKTIKENLN